MLADAPEPAARLIAMIPIGEAAMAAALPLTHRLRGAGLAVDLGFRGNLQRRMKRANKIGARAAVLMGEDELAAGAATVRDLDSGEQEQVALGALRDYLDRFR